MKKFTCWAPECGEAEGVSGQEHEAVNPRRAAENFAAAHWEAYVETPRDLVVAVRDGEKVWTFDVEPDFSVSYDARERT